MRGGRKIFILYVLIFILYFIPRIFYNLKWISMIGDIIIPTLKIRKYKAEGVKD